MTIHLDHTIVPARDKLESAHFFAEIFGLSIKPDHSHFAQVRVNEHLTLDFSDQPETWGQSEFDPAGRESHHYAFHIDDAEFDAIFERIKARGIPYGSGPFSPDDGKINHRRGGRGFYFPDPSGHLLEVMTVAESAADSL
jgi:catechol 2,3-dioxygenase-like lactoylglutathione lyase family enzyme